MRTEKELTTALSTLTPFQEAQPGLEQYSTPPALAAKILYSNTDAILNKTILDLGAGTGILGIGALLIGAKKVTFIEKDTDATKLLTHNLKNIPGEWTIIPADLKLTDEHADTIIMNPPFGTRNKNADSRFLEYALTHATTTITLHKTSTKEHIRRMVKRLGKKIRSEEDVTFTLNHTMKHHTRPSEDIAVTIFTIR